MRFAHSTRRSVTAVAFSVLSVGAAAVTPGAQPQGGAGKDAKPPTVLFMCPHGAAKSVLASAYFQRLAKERGLNVRVVSAGTDPDPQVAPAVVTHLTKNGYEVPVSTPRRVTASDVAAADVVISIGCDLKDLPPPRGKLVKWDDVPSPSERFTEADDVIRRYVTALVDDLVKQTKAPQK